MTCSAQSKAQATNHPKPGSSIKVEPIRDLEAIQAIKALLADTPRDLCLFTLGINTAYRANELVSLRVSDVAHLEPGDRIDLKQSKNGNYRATRINGVVHSALQLWLAGHPEPETNAPLFKSKRGMSALCVSEVSRKVKAWCAAVGLHGNYASHTMRKTWGYHQRKTFGRPTALLTQAYGHASEAQTLAYLCIDPEEVEELYSDEL